MSTAVNNCQIFTVSVSIFEKPCFPSSRSMIKGQGRVGQNETHCVVFEENMAPLVLDKKQRSHQKRESMKSRLGKNYE